MSPYPWGTHFSENQFVHELTQIILLTDSFMSSFMKLPHGRISLSEHDLSMEITRKEIQNECFI